MIAVDRIKARIETVEALAAAAGAKPLGMEEAHRLLVAEGMLAGLRLALADAETAEEARPRVAVDGAGLGRDPLSESCRAHLASPPPAPAPAAAPPPFRMTGPDSGVGPIRDPGPAAAPPAAAKPHWTARETSEERAARMEKARRSRLNPPPPPPPAPSADETAMGAAVAAALAKNERVKALIRDGAELSEHDIADRTGLPLREVYRLKAEVREERRGGGAAR